MNAEQPQDDQLVTWEWLCGLGVVTANTKGPLAVELPRRVIIQNWTGTREFILHDRSRSLGYGILINGFRRNRFRALYYGLTGEQLEE